MLHYEPTYHDQSIDPLIQQILPDIEQSLKKQLMSELQHQAQLQFEKELVKIQAQAYQQYQLAVHELEQQGKKLFREQTQDLKKQIEKLRKQKKIKEQNHLKSLQDHFISQNFQQLILGHPKIQQIQKQLGQQILRSSQQKIQSTKQRRMRQISVKMQNKQQKYKKDRDKAIKNQVYQSRSVDQVRKDLQIMKIGIASMKSEYNIKIKKIDSEIKQIKQRNRVLQSKENINQLRSLLQKLQDKRDEINEKILYQQQVQQRQKEKQKQQLKNNNTFSHLESSQQQCSQYLIPPHVQSSETMMQRNSAVTQEQEDYESQSQSGESQQYNNQYFVKAPKYQPSDEVSQENLQTFQNQVPILKLNVASLLRTNWQDPLQKYVARRSQNRQQDNQYNEDQNMNNWDLNNNENDQKVGNKPSFQQIYHQHLQKLNQATKRRRLSNQAKKTLIKNLSLLGKNKY